MQLGFNNDLAPYILTKPIHGSQKKVKHDNNGLHIEIEVIPNTELKQILLSYGSSVEVIAPKSFRNEIIKTIKLMK